ncbi:MAG TPA: outer membrane lipoprotein carrier protein LolA [Bacteroidia bacterium]|nr:outer membrane lipoprotein carrier protein LolA [Bacteroidia bacterium]
MKTHSLFAGFATVALFALPVVLLAQTPAKTGPGYDPKAKAILDGVSATAKAYQSITATFSITMEKPAPDKTKDVKNGTVILKGNMYKITLENKDAKNVVTKEEYYNDGKTLWVYNEKQKETTIDDAPDPAKKKNENQISPTEIFTIHEKGFKYTFIEEKTEGGVVVQYIDLIPEQPDKKNYHKIKLKIDKAKKQIMSITQMNKDGSKTTYLVKTFTPNVVYTDATFRYDKAAHPGVEVIDLRIEEE